VAIGGQTFKTLPIILSLLFQNQPSNSGHEYGCNNAQLALNNNQSIYKQNTCEKFDCIIVLYTQYLPTQDYETDTPHVAFKKLEKGP